MSVEYLTVLFECLFVVLFSLLGLLITLRQFLGKIFEERKEKKRIEKGRRIGEGKRGNVEFESFP